MSATVRKCAMVKPILGRHLIDFLLDLHLVVDDFDSDIVFLHAFSE